MVTRAVRAHRNPFVTDKFSHVAFTVGAEVGNVKKVTLAVQTARRGAVTGPVGLRVWLTQNATTKIVAPTAPSGTVVVAAKGAIVATVTAKLVFDVVTDANGEFDLNITEAGVATWYVVAQLPSGELLVSGAVTFA